MAIIRKELVVKDLDGNSIYDCLAEVAGDISVQNDDLADVGIGSLCYCWADKTVYKKSSDGTWEVQA